MTIPNIGSFDTKKFEKNPLLAASEVEASTSTGADFLNGDFSGSLHGVLVIYDHGFLVVLSSRFVVLDLSGFSFQLLSKKLLITGKM